MKRMRIILWLSIIVFMSTLFWPQLLGQSMLTITFICSCLLLVIPRLRILAVIPFSALYFTIYATLTLTGQSIIPSYLSNENGLADFVDGQDHIIVVQISSLISDNNRSYFNAKLIEIDNDHLNYSPMIAMRWYKSNVDLQDGQLHRFLVRFKPVYGRANPGGFDRQKWSYSEHIAYQATIKKHLTSINTEGTIRSQFYEKVKEITEGLKHQGLILALSFADKSLIPFEKKQLIRNLGISHLFAISGLHIGLIFSFIYFAAHFVVNRLLSTHYKGWFSIRLINYSALIGAWGYAYLAGFSLPTQRAFLMLLIAVVILSLKRRCAKADLLLLVLFIVLVWDPLAVLSISLWLSFSAVAIIVLLFWISPINTRQKAGPIKQSLLKRLIQYSKVLVFLQIGLTLLMLPIQLISFSGISLVSILVNLIAVPLFSLLVIPLVLLASFVTLFIPSIASLLFILPDQLISSFFYLTNWLNQSYQLFSLQTTHWLLLTFSLAVMFFVIYFHATAIRTISYCFVFIFVTLVGVNYFQQLKATNEEKWSVETIDVGQGLAVLVRSAGQVMLYDTGARYPSGFNMVESEIIPYLTSQGIKQIDQLVISHSDNDHSGGADIVAEYLPILARWSGEPLTSQYDFKPCYEGANWQLGRLNVQVLSPDKILKNNNNNSCVLKISDGSISLLLTGDIEKRQEKRLVEQFSERLRSDILFAPHHGSRHSSSEAFIHAVSPEWVIFSAGFMNHWGFPASEVIERYEKQSVKMSNSGLSGLIRFQISHQTIKMETFREDLAPYWYHHSFLP